MLPAAWPLNMTPTKTIGPGLVGQQEPSRRKCCMRQGMAMFTLQISLVLLRSQEVMRYLHHTQRSPSSEVESPSARQQRAGRGRISVSVHGLCSSCSSGGSALQ
ncbi:hypothetical protein CRENBAI_016513 [Crenichthys baileyi]|uniref:Uncharacterized protein n=1 Tax=Crenichthys baileyi TaxID=28760 RepID=A0AAV9S6N4_9TELE